MTFPTLSVIIPRKAQESAEAAVQAVLHCDYPQELLEIIEVLGENPSRQRNLGAERAQGDILYFLDNDSIVTPDLFSRVMIHYTRAESGKTCEDIAGVGGPNLTPQNDAFWQKVSGHALASFFAHFKMASRYKAIGTVRFSDERELILCNFSIRRDVFLQEGGLNEQLYPNEENEFLNRSIEHGHRFLYDPEASIERSRRKDMRSFIRQLSNYGRGRAEQILVEGFSTKSLLFFLPSGFLLYLLVLPILNIGLKEPCWTFVPFLLYLIPALLSALQSTCEAKNLFLLPLLPCCYLIMHLSYGAGLLFGFAKAAHCLKEQEPPRSQQVEVIIRSALGK
ncbi:glycosyl transferase family 2 [candidate division KSB3 bacterium]|uniref:Glycosyl transferase family 2 n=1 Tax=candidate division KSB3 bacterium TaxID=2044937 RepID=A0A2G6E3H7_9BACT|nr:MAG: glycosyl transferase family 2 [candidate division KSB3 bacterium]PIE29082.1 MAG: glycosyl transferase family 2 [candidate division KSB3 bacterium]